MATATKKTAAKTLKVEPTTMTVVGHDGHVNGGTVRVSVPAVLDDETLRVELLCGQHGGPDDLNPLVVLQAADKAAVDAGLYLVEADERGFVIAVSAEPPTDFQFAYLVQNPY